MYPPPQHANIPKPASSKRGFFSRGALLRPRSIVALMLITTVFALLSLYRIGDVPMHFNPETVFANDTFSFVESPRPAYLTTPLQTPLVLRIAIIARRNEFRKRKSIRESVLRGIITTEVQIDYRFFVGGTSNIFKEAITSLRLGYENLKHGDITELSHIADIPERLSEKRYSAIKWGGELSSNTYDYFFTMDSDTFCRIGALARSLPHLYSEKKIKPREQPVLIGRMGSHLTYFLNIVQDGNKDPRDQDQFIRGPWFSYPIGIGYMMRQVTSSLVATILSATPPLPHHIHYPSDDVMIGAWIAGMRLFHDPSTTFSTIAETPELEHSITPMPYFPQMVETEVLDDLGWHNFPGRYGPDGKIGWASTCVHRMSPMEMKTFREMKEIKGEWEVEGEA